MTTRPTARFAQSSFDERYTQAVRLWLDRRFGTVEREEYVAHEPIWGIPSRGRTEGGHTRRAARLLDVLSIAGSLEVESFLDVGGAEGYLAFLAQQALGVEAVSVDISTEACARAMELCGVPAISANASQLPFATDAFDVVTITEVIEHLVDPVGALLEARRVARRAVIVTSEEFALSEGERDFLLQERTLEDHGERNVFIREDFDAIFHGMHLTHFEQRFAPAENPAGEVKDEQFTDWLTGRIPFDSGGGIIVASPDPLDLVEIPRSQAAHVADIMLRGIPNQIPQDRTKTDKANLEFPSRTTASGTAVVDAFVYTEAAERIDALASLHSLPEEVTQRLLQLNRRFELFPNKEELFWSGADMTDGNMGWDLQNFHVSESGLGRTSGDDPRWISPYLCVPASDLFSLELKFEIQDEDQEECLQLYFQLAGDMEFTQEKCLSVSFRTKEAARGLRIPLSGLPVSEPWLMRIRIDPILRGDGIPIRMDCVRFIARS